MISVLGNGEIEIWHAPDIPIIVSSALEEVECADCGELTPDGEKHECPRGDDD